MLADTWLIEGAISKSEREIPNLSYRSLLGTRLTFVLIIISPAGLRVKANKIMPEIKKGIRAKEVPKGSIGIIANISHFLT